MKPWMNQTWEILTSIRDFPRKPFPVFGEAFFFIVLKYCFFFIQKMLRYSSIEFDIWICHLLQPTPVSDVVSREHWDDQSFMSSPSPVNITHLSKNQKSVLKIVFSRQNKQKRCERNLWKQGANIDVLGHIGQKREEKKVFVTECLSIPAKKGQLAFMPVSASGGMERYADFAPLGLPKIQHFCFLFAILSHKLISILRKTRVCQKYNTFAFAILPLQSISIFGETINGLSKVGVH